MTEYDFVKQGDKKYTFEDAVHVLERLIAPDGCPWDREQTRESLRKNMIEEAYEAVDAIDSKNDEKFKDELGDVLLQVLLNAVISEKDKGFTLLDITDNLCRKLISRHTHVFGNDTANSGEESLFVWDKNKAKEKGFTNYAETLRDIPVNLPSLMRADKLQKRAGKSGFDWDDAKGAQDKINEELAEVHHILKQRKTSIYEKTEQTVNPEFYDELEDELGDLLFSVVNYARLLGIDSEIALNRSNEKFLRRFSRMEQLSMEQSMENNMDFTSLSLAEKDKLWEAVKMEEKRNEVG